MKASGISPNLEGRRDHSACLDWHREILEDYTAVSFEQYERIFSLLGMEVEFEEGYLLPYLRENWRERLGFSEAELTPLLSTGLIMARKPHRFGA